MNILQCFYLIMNIGFELTHWNDCSLKVDRQRNPGKRKAKAQTSTFTHTSV